MPLRQSRIRPGALAVLTALAVAALAMLLSAPAPAPAADPIAQAARSCSAPDYPGQGYFTSLRVTRTSCTSGKKVALAHYRCRVRKGLKGRCTKRVRRYRCTEKRNSIPTQIDARVTCRKGSAKVVFSYQQDI